TRLVAGESGDGAGTDGTTSISGGRPGRSRDGACGLRQLGVHRTSDGGRSWVDCTLPERAVFSLAVSAADGAVYAGTEPTRLFRADDDGIYRKAWANARLRLPLPRGHPPHVRSLVNSRSKSEACVSRPARARIN